MDIRPSAVIDGVQHLTLEQHFDGRGYFMETYRSTWLPPALSCRATPPSLTAGVLRGLHYHLRQEDLWFIPSGIALVTLIDLRASSSTYLPVEQFELTGPQAVYIPIGVAHGFYAPAETLMSYLVSGYYDGSDELGVRWNDPDLEDRMAGRRAHRVRPRPDGPQVGGCSRRASAVVSRRYLVTGGAGFIGSNFIRRVLEHEPDAQITNLDSLTYAGVKATVDELDASDRTRLSTATSATRPGRSAGSRPRRGRQLRRREPCRPVDRWSLGVPRDQRGREPACSSTPRAATASPASSRSRPTRCTARSPKASHSRTPRSIRRRRIRLRRPAVTCSSARTP